jgi:hypothetical protein
MNGADLKKIVLCCLTAALVFSACGTSPRPGAAGAVITVGDRSVFADNVTESFERFRGDTLSINVLKDNILARELFIAHAIELGFRDDREVQRLIHERTREILQTEWTAFVTGQVESDTSAVREFWQLMGTGVAYTCFYHNDSLVMDSVLALTRGGTDLSVFSMELGMDEILKQSRGLIVTEDIQFANTSDVEHLRGASVGDLIGPYPVPAGFRLIQIDSIWTYTPASFETESPRISAMLLARDRESRKQFLEDSLKTAYNVQTDMDVINLMCENADERGAMFGAFQPEQEELIAVTWNGGSRTLFSVAENITGLPGFLPRSTDDALWLSDYAKRLALFDIEMAEAILFGLDTIPETARRIEAKEWETVLDKYYEMVIVPRITPDSILCQEIYLAIRNDNPVLESRVYDVLFLENNDRIQAAEAMMASGEDVLAAREQFAFFPPILAEGEETTTVPLTRSMIPENDTDALFNLEPGAEVIVALSDSTALWFRLAGINEEHIPSFEEVRNLVMNEANQQMETAAIEALVDSLSEVYHPYVDEAFFEGFYVPAPSDSTNTGSAQEVI